MSTVWISKESWEKVWSALHNIQVRQNFAVRTPCATLSGSGSSARLNIDLPGTTSTGSGTAEYNGLFKLIDASETVETPDPEGGSELYTEDLLKIVVADGATYDAKTQTSNYGLCSVDCNSFSVPPWISDSLNGEVSVEQPEAEKIVVLKYTPYQPAVEATGTEGEEDYQEGTPEIPAAVTVEILDDIPLYPNRIIYYLLGRVFLTYDGETESVLMKLQQDHTTGEVFMDAYYSGMFACDWEAVYGKDGEEKIYLTVSEGTFTVASTSFEIAAFKTEFTGAGFLYLVYNPDGFESDTPEKVYARIEYRNSTLPTSNYLTIGKVEIATTEEGAEYPVLTQLQKDDFFILIDMDIYTGDFAVFTRPSGVVVKAGATDIGNTPDTEFGEEANGKSIWLIGLSDGESYSVKLYCGDEEPEGTYKSSPIQIATVDLSGIPHQVWKSGKIRFADRYLL